MPIAQTAIYSNNLDTMTDRLPKLRINGEFAIHQNNAPLYDRAPTRDEQGKPYSDFMVLIPKLNKTAMPELKSKMAAMQAVLGSHPEVVFADLNMKINLLWVSFKPKIGLIEQITCEIQARVPEAKLISGEFGAHQ